MRKILHLEKTIYGQADLVAPDAPQIALAGRSNVGKSSLLNRLAGRKQLAKTSSTPGKTQSINLYRIEPGDVYLVDLPGYGYARRSKEERAKWAELIERYLSGTAWLRAVAVLLDCRLTPQASDLDMVAWLRASDIPVIGVLTKIDKCKKREQQSQQNRWAGLLGGEKPVLFSSVTGAGYEDLWRRIDIRLGIGEDQPAAASEGTPEIETPASGNPES
ncbi:ribosome biogenesis GTP-binding protein YihA/YsxC [Fundidesulfovibrio putealis]|uniref:ribosome biogenesis GTP-binding protein YihA/YsxC n=1 Tax=Fundidesulfovibrio putealis TaxID=270496 RepID=UPI000417231E|nr:ribosome biogenesis GTP-binding protein YihA/YsxC [Fundidesulfovibrio putealis]